MITARSQHARIGSEQARFGRRRTALAVVFAIKGIAFAATVARLPAVREAFGLSTGQLGLLMLCFSGGAITGLPIAGPLVRRAGARAAVIAGGSAVGAGMGALAAALLARSVPPAAVGMALIGLGNGIWDVAINAEGVDIERRSGKPLLPRLHGAFSIGTIVGAGLGTATAAVNVPLAAQIAVFACVVPVSLAVLSRWFVSGRSAPPSASSRAVGLLGAWRDLRTLALGLLVFGFAFTEGSANDWIAIAFVNGHHAAQAVGALAYSMFVTAMTVGRLTGSWIVSRFGRVSVLRGSAATAGLGLLLVLLSGTTFAFAGSLLWGAGAALGFPLGISSAGEGGQEDTAGRVSVVSSVGYAAFLAGPPVLGLIAGRIGILNALLIVLGGPLIALLAASAARPPAQEQLAGGAG